MHLQPFVQSNSTRNHRLSGVKILKSKILIQNVQNYFTTKTAFIFGP